MRLIISDELGIVLYFSIREENLVSIDHSIAFEDVKRVRMLGLSF